MGYLGVFMVRFIEYDTGELVDFTPSNERGWESYCMLNLKEHKRVCTKCKGVVLLVLSYMLVHISDGNYVTCRQQEIADDIGSDRSNVNRAIKKLRNLNVIRKVRNSNYQINPDYVWKGKYKQRVIAVKNFKEGS